MQRILVDTSFWIHFFRGKKEAKILQEWLYDDRVILHPLVYGELLLGGISKYQAELIRALPRCETLADTKIYDFIFEYRLAGFGIGWVDVSLLANALQGSFWIATFDKPLITAASKLEIGIP